MSETAEKVQLTIQLPEELRRRAKIAAAKQGNSLSSVIREALEEYIDRVEDAEAGPRAQAIYEKWLADPSTARSWEDFKAEMEAEDEKGE